MTNDDFKKWAALTGLHQVTKFKKARKAINLTQPALGEKLELYGYKGGAATVKAWEQGRAKIPPLVYELVFEGFAERTGEGSE
jgi:DNA-binding transcriptional regulator YiaG